MNIQPACMSMPTGIRQSLNVWLELPLKEGEVIKKKKADTFEKGGFRGVPCYELSLMISRTSIY